jgi:hypothetical protein
MKRIIKLTENQLRNIVSKVIKEQLVPMGNPNTFTSPVNSSSQERIANIAKTLTANKGVLPRDYIVKYDINPIELQAAKSLIGQQKTTQDTQNQRNKNIVNAINSIDPQSLLIKSSNPKLNGMTWKQYRDTFKITDVDIANAKSYLSKTNLGDATKLDKVEKSSKPNPKVTELQKQLKAAGYDLGLTGPNKDGIDGIMGSKTRAAQQKQASDKVKQMGSDSKNTINNTIKNLSQLTPQQQATADALSKTPPLVQNVSEDDDIAMLDNLFKKD